MSRPVVVGYDPRRPDRAPVYFGVEAARIARTRLIVAAVEASGPEPPMTAGQMVAFAAAQVDHDLVPDSGARGLLPLAMTVIACPHCGRKNRVGSRSHGVPGSGNCHNLLPWIADATPETFEAEIAASVPVLVDFWAPWCGPWPMVSPAVEAQARDRRGSSRLDRHLTPATKA